MVTVWNRFLLRIKDATVSQDEIEEIGFMLRRVWFTAQAYKARKNSRTLEGWLNLLKRTATEAGLGS